MEKADVLKIKKIIDGNQTKKIQLETKLETEYKTAKTDFSCETLEEIEDKLEEGDKGIAKIEKKIKTKSETLEEAYDWDI